MITYNQIQVRQGNSLLWESVNPILNSGEPGYEDDTGKIKIGNGTDRWNDLKYTTDNISAELKQYIDESLQQVTTKSGMNIQTGVERDVPSIYSFTEEDGVPLKDPVPEYNKLDYEKFEGAWHEVVFPEPFESIPTVNYNILGNYQQTFGANANGLITIGDIRPDGFKFKHRSGYYNTDEGNVKSITVSWIAIGK